MQKIIGIGRAFTDIIATVDDDYLNKFHISKGVGKRVSEDQLKAMISELNNPVYMAGGSVANTIAGVNALGMKTGFIGKTARDKSGKFFSDEFHITGVNFYNNVTDHGVSGTCLCLNTDDGNRSFAFTVGVCEDLTPDDMPLSVFSEAHMMVLQVMMLETAVCFNAAKEIFPKLPSHVKKVMCLHDLSDKGEISEFMLQHSDVIIGSEIEFDHILDIKTEQDLQIFCKDGNSIAALTRGEKGAVICNAEEAQKIAAIPPIEIIDTVGAGDFFAAGFLYGIANNLDLKSSGNLGAKCASLILEQIGGRPNPETSKKLNMLVS